MRPLLPRVQPSARARSPSLLVRPSLADRRGHRVLCLEPDVDRRPEPARQRRARRLERDDRASVLRLEDSHLDRISMCLRPESRPQARLPEGTFIRARRLPCAVYCLERDLSPSRRDVSGMTDARASFFTCLSFGPAPSSPPAVSSADSCSGSSSMTSSSPSASPSAAGSPSAAAPGTSDWGGLSEARWAASSASSSPSVHFHRSGSSPLTSATRTIEPTGKRSAMQDRQLSIFPPHERVGAEREGRTAGRDEIEQRGLSRLEAVHDPDGRREPADVAGEGGQEVGLGEAARGQERR